MGWVRGCYYCLFNRRWSNKHLYISQPTLLETMSRLRASPHTQNWSDPPFRWFLRNGWWRVCGRPCHDCGGYTYLPPDAQAIIWNNAHGLKSHCNPSVLQAVCRTFLQVSWHPMCPFHGYQLWYEGSPKPLRDKAESEVLSCDNVHLRIPRHSSFKIRPNLR